MSNLAGRRPPEPTTGRATVAAAGFVVQLAFGSVYAWSVFLKPLQELHDASRAEIGATFTLTLVTLGITAAFGGATLARLGPRRAAALAGLLYGAGVALAGLAPNLAGLYLAYGILGGIGLGLGYIVPLAVLLRWFPDRRGFITGLAVAGFGLGALVAGPLAAALIQAVGVRWTLVALGLLTLVVVVAAARFLTPAPEGYAPPGWTPPRPLSPGPVRSRTLAQALRDPLWSVLWLILAVNVSAGAALLAVAAPLAQELTGVDAGKAAGLVGVMSLSNGLGRLAWGSASDRIGRPVTFLALFALQGAAFAALATVDRFAPLLLGAALVAFCYGGGFGTMPAYAADLFGPDHAGTVYGAMLTAWSAGAVVGPALVTLLPARTALLVIAALMLAAMPLPVLAQAMARRAAHR